MAALGLRRLLTDDEQQATAARALGFGVSFASNAIIARIGGEDAWRWMLGIAAVPSVIFAVMCFGLPESPRWLIGRKGDRTGGLAILRLIEPALPPAKLEAHADEIAAAVRSEETTASQFWTWRLRVPILLAFLVAFFNQLSGINAVLYFAPRIFEMTGLGKEAALLQSEGSSQGVNPLFATHRGPASQAGLTRSREDREVGWIVSRLRAFA